MKEYQGIALVIHFHHSTYRFQPTVQSVLKIQEKSIKTIGRDVTRAEEVGNVLGRGAPLSSHHHNYVGRDVTWGMELERVQGF